VKDRHFFYRSFDHLFLYITGRCNCRCEYCYLGNALQADMSIDAVQEISGLFECLGTRYVTVLGGEPTLHPRFIEIIEMLANRGFYVVVDTNGMFENTLFDKLSPRHIYRLLFSLDVSRPEAAGNLRVGVDYDYVKRNIVEALRLGFNVGIITCLNQENCNEAVDMQVLGDKLGVSLVNFHRLMPQGRGRKLVKHIIGPDDWIETCRTIEDYAKSMKPVVLYPPVFCRPEEYNKYKSLGYLGCTARSADRISILPDGTVKLCSLFLDTKTSLRSSTERAHRDEHAFEQRVDLGVLNCAVV